MAGAGIFEFTDANFDQEVLKSEQPVLVDFWAGWCGPCKMIAPAVESIAASYAGKVKVGKVNVDPERRHAFALRHSRYSRTALLQGRQGS